MTYRTVVVGAGVGGLCAAIDLAARGVDVVVLEATAAAGGKLRRVGVEGRSIDVGPTVFTMRWVFEELFAASGANFEDYVELEAPAVIARHRWFGDGEQALDLYADVSRSREAIREFAGSREANGYLKFVEYSRRIFEAVDEPFLRSQKPSLRAAIGLASKLGLSVFSRIDAHRTMHNALRDFFRDPRLLQLFGRYATYAGSSPFEAPATLHVIAHVEQRGVWLVRGGMYRLIEGLQSRAEELGVRFGFECPVSKLVIESGCAAGVQLRSGETIRADAVVFNGDVGALAGGWLGSAASQAVSHSKEPSLSAVTVAFLASVKGRDLARHNLFFSSNSRREFDDLFSERRIPNTPTVYVCAADRDGQAALVPNRERLFALINAPSLDHRQDFTAGEANACAKKMISLLNRAGLELTELSEMVISSPATFEQLCPGSSGAIYGAATHGMIAPFSRMGATSKLAGLFLAGGTAHPGAGVPMAAASGRLAATAVLEALASTRTSIRVGTSGSTSTL